ncbi:MAG: hypothetical protein RMX68_008630 [Aulosira sp. ZfuVER01]|nr:hypothetical protein [Aulosira sp. ZfuVER01]MDZ7997430.1 hypothetical protein [Aulosira sp. DedVER01a]MDZ8054541.1 hypothetical protein [Aulosira sp. ZfuCHP01]
MSVQEYYQIVINSTGQAYLDAEQELIAQGESIVPFLQEQRNTADPIARLITQVILQWIINGETFQACLDYFKRAEARAAGSILRAPPPEGVVNYLIKNFGDSVAPLLSVYLIKLNQIWPDWKTLSAILYLGKLDSKDWADPLIQFLFTTNNEHYLNLAVQSLAEVGDVSVLNKINSLLNLPELTETTRIALQQAADRIRGRLGRI